MCVMTVCECARSNGFRTAGVLPFGAIFIELFFILSSLWLHHYYYLFPFLFLGEWCAKVAFLTA